MNHLQLNIALRSLMTILPEKELVKREPKIIRSEEISPGLFMYQTDEPGNKIYIG